MKREKERDKQRYANSYNDREKKGENVRNVRMRENERNTIKMQYLLKS